MKAYSLDLRQKVLAAALRGDRSLREVAELFGVGKTFVDKLLGLHRAGEDLAPRPHGGGYPARLLPRHEKLLCLGVRQRQDATLEELRPSGRASRTLSQRLDGLALAHPPRPGA